MSHFLRSIISVLASVVLTSNFAAAQPYDFELVNNGAVIADTSTASNDNTAFPSVIRIPDWLAPEDRADPSAVYYMYWGNHSGNAIKMKWATEIDGTWTDYNFTGGTGPEPSRGVFDVGPDTNDPTRDDYDHISAPDVVVDDANQRFIMYFHGEREASFPAPRVHQRFVTTSGTGLNFNSPTSGNGEPGYGPVEVTSEGVTRDVYIGADYMKTFQKNDGRWYGVGKRAVINAAPATGDIWAPPQDDPFGEAWDRADTPEPNWAELTSGLQDSFRSTAATFFASQEFADHPNNPIPNRRILSNGNAERLNHVEVNVLPGDLLEVFFYVREARSSDDDDYPGIYRFLYDISDPDFQLWTVARDESNQVIFDVVLEPADFIAAMEAALGPGYDPLIYADPYEFGDTELFFDDDGSKYLFFSYVSEEFGGQQGEGAISAVRLISTVQGDFDADGDVDADDINFYSGKIGEDIAGNLPEMDLDGDGTITLADHNLHITTLAQTSNGETGTFLGDLNLDGSVDVLGDAFALIGSLNLSGSDLYAQGDLNANQTVDVLGDAFLLIGSLGQSNSSTE